MATPSESAQQLNPEASHGHLSRRMAGLVWITWGKIVHIAGYISFVSTLVVWSTNIALYAKVIASIIFLTGGLALLFTTRKWVQHGRKRNASKVTLYL
jgi:hypothetical protein